MAPKVHRPQVAAYKKAHARALQRERLQKRKANARERDDGGREAIYALRQELGLTQEEFATLCGVAQNTVCYWETVSAPQDWRERTRIIRQWWREQHERIDKARTM